MELEEANKKLQITPEEEASIHRYLGFQHTRINILADLNPNVYMNLKSSGWDLPEKPEDFKQAIEDFVNVYSAMYKNSRNSSLNAKIVRGTDKTSLGKMGFQSNQFLSASTDESVAKRFCKYGDAALVNIHLKNGVPFLDAEQYREESGTDESEIIVAPFCKVTKNEHYSDFNGYSYYNVSLEKQNLEPIAEENKDTLMQDVIESFSQNISDMQDFMRLRDMPELWEERYKRAQDREDRLYILEQKGKDYDRFEEKRKATYEFKIKLTKLLKGLCKNKELEIDKADQVISAEQEKVDQERTRKFEEQRKVEQERIAKEQEAKQAIEAEQKRTTSISSLSQRILKGKTESGNLENTVVQTYNTLAKNETKFMEVAAILGVPYTKTTSNTSVYQRVMAIQQNLKNIRNRMQENASLESDSLESSSQKKGKLNPLLEGMSYGLEIASDFPQIVNTHIQQSDREIKRNLYFKVQKSIQNARAQKYVKDVETLKTQKIGFLGGLNGKADLQIEKINNLNLKITAAQTTVPQEQEKYSARDMLSDMYAVAMTEFGGQFTPEMSEIYRAISQVYSDKKTGEFTEEYIKSLAVQKIANQKATLPMVPKKGGISFLGKTKSQIELLKLENEGLRAQINVNMSGNSMQSYTVREQDAIALFENKLNAIQSVTTEKENTKAKDLNQTQELWGK